MMNLEEKIESICKDIISMAKEQKESSNLVSAIHGIWGDIGLKLADEMMEINRKEAQK